MIDRQPSQDAVNTLIFTITKHFVGDPNQYKERASDVLINLRCPQLLDFRWYKDVFFFFFEKKVKVLYYWKSS